MTAPSRRNGPAQTDDGFTLIELIVSIGIFSALMAMVSTFAVAGIRTIHTGTALSQAQAQGQQAEEWLSRLLRYADNPVETVPVTSAITYAGTLAGQPTLTFHTYAGTGALDRVPYKVTLTTNANGIVTQLWTPSMSTGTPVYSGPGQQRVLVTRTPQNTPTLRLRYWAGTVTAPVELTPPANGSLTAAQMDSLRAVQVTIGGSGSSMLVDRTIVLENPRS